MNVRFGLTHYDAARRELAEASRIDEVKGIRDKAEAMQKYAKLAKDMDLIGYATEIRMRAERRAGELLAEMAERKERHSGKAPKGSRVATPTAAPKLADLGVTKSQSSRWQKMAAMPEEEFEEDVATNKLKAVSAVSRTNKSKPKGQGRRKSAPKRSAFIGPIDRCTMSVRNLVLEFMRDMKPDETTKLIAALRDEIADLEKVAELKNSDGHHTEREPA